MGGDRVANISPETKRHISVAVAFLIIFFAVFAIIFQRPSNDDFKDSGGKYYDLVRSYMQTEYTEAYSADFEVAYVEKLSNYKESVNSDKTRIKAEFVMNAYYKDSKPYDDFNELHPSDYKLKIEAKLEDGALSDVTLYSGTDDGKWIRLDRGLKDFIITE